MGCVRSGNVSAPSSRENGHVQNSTSRWRVASRRLRVPDSSDAEIARSSVHPAILSAAPILEVADDLARQLQDLRRVAPSSDATAALGRYQALLADAIQRASTMRLAINTDDAALLLGRSVSSVARRCRTGAIAARKVGGVWVIDREEFERCLSRRGSDSRV
jgi:hypothetical protein